jgi:UDPglucose 6-dehydrogenase
MKISVVGLGFVGLVTSVVLSRAGNNVICIDTDESKINRLNKGELYIYEPKLDSLFTDQKSKMRFETDYSDVKGSDLTFVCVPTPTVNGRSDLSFVRDAVTRTGKVDRETIIVIKSTVLPGTAKSLSSAISNRIISNPEFLREGSAVDDTLHPDRIVIGGRDNAALDKVEGAWRFCGSPIVRTTNENAELIKYASNSFLAAKISFINEISDLCERIPGTDVEIIAKGMGLDHRIGREFLRAGLGFGGSCFPKDTRAIAEYANKIGTRLSIVESAIDVNERRVERGVKIIENTMGSLNGKRICLLGLSFKENTNDLRESRALDLARALRERGALVYAYDPVIKDIEGIGTLRSAEECDGMDCVVVSSEWKEFEDLPLFKRANNVIDLKRIVNTATNPSVKSIGVGYAKN